MTEIEQIRKLKKSGKTIVFTNGCFDILHVGHLEFLEEAYELGDILVIGLNSDKSVYNLKGEGRPINPLEKRKIMLQRLSCVDFVIPFDGDTPIKLIKEIRPDILVKGDDYKKEQIAGAESVEADGGEVILIHYAAGNSTSDIIKRIREGTG